MPNSPGKHSPINREDERERDLDKIKEDDQETGSENEDQMNSVIENPGPDKISQETSDNIGKTQKITVRPGNQEYLPMISSITRLPYNIQYSVYCDKLKLKKFQAVQKAFVEAESGLKLELGNINLGPNGFLPVASVISNMAKIKKLDVSYNQLQEEGIQFFSMIDFNSNFLTSLNLSGNLINKDGLNKLAGVLRKLNKLEQLILADNQIGDVKLDLLSDYLKNNKNLLHLDLSHNKISSEGANTLAICLPKTSLKHLNISWNEICNRGAGKFGECLIKTRLEIIDISWNSLSSSGAIAIKDGIQYNNNLLELNLVANRIDCTGGKAIAKALMNNFKLKSLKIGNNPMSDKAVIEILNGILRNHQSSVECLDVEGIIVNDKILELVDRITEYRDFDFIYSTTVKYDKRFITRGDLDPFDILNEYLSRNMLRVVDFFRILDKDGLKMLTKFQFMENMKRVGVPLTWTQMKVIAEYVDPKNEDKITYQNLFNQMRFYKVEQRDFDKRRFVKNAEKPQIPGNNVKKNLNVKENKGQLLPHSKSTEFKSKSSPQNGSTSSLNESVGSKTSSGSQRKLAYNQPDQANSKGKK